MDRKKDYIMDGEDDCIMDRPCCPNCAAAHELAGKEGRNADSAGTLKDNDNDAGKYIIRISLAAIFTVIINIIKVSAYIEISVFLLAFALAGYEILITAARNILKGRVFDENFLMGLASVSAFLMGDRTEGIAVLVFYGVGELFQDMAVNKSRKNIAGLMDIRPDYANKISEGVVTEVAPDQIETGDMILVKPGERIPLDGIIRSGSSFIDTAALTGESVPREVFEEDQVLSGTVNINGVLEVEVTAPYGESTVSRILDLVRTANARKAESEKFITRFAGYYTPAVVISAALVAVFPPLLGFGPFTLWLYRALSFLIISCPCALVISIPLSFFGGIGGAARQGILVKGGNYLDALKQVDTIVFDKTGTLTRGVFEVTKVCPADGVEASELVSTAAAAESRSNHPIAKSILAYCNKENINLENQFENINEIAGQGVTAQRSNGTIICAGNEKLMRSCNIPFVSTDTAGSIVHVACDGRYLGYLLISDEVKEGAKKAVNALRQLGIRRIVMLTGDNEKVANETAAKCGIDDYKSQLLPQDKVAWFEQYKNEASGKGKVVFAGDGINDAPVLAGADIGIAMGGIGSDAAVEAADVVIMNDDPGKIAAAIKIARKTKRIVFQNIIFALGVKIIIMVLAFLGLTSIWFAIFADVGVALLALLNAMRAMYYKA